MNSPDVAFRQEELKAIAEHVRNATERMLDALVAVGEDGLGFGDVAHALMDARLATVALDNVLRSTITGGAP